MRSKAPHERFPIPSVLVMCMALSAGCAHEKASDLSAVRKELGAIADSLTGTGRQSYFDRLSQKQKIALSDEGVKALIQKNGSETAKVAALLKDPGEITLEAVVTAPSGESLKLICEKDGWKVEEGVFLEGRAETPLQACKTLLVKLNLLREALQEETYFSLSLKNNFTDGLDLFLSELGSLADRDFTLDGNHGYAVLPSGRRIEVVTEGGQWKVSKIIPLPFKY